jgi:hypothetical protein
MKNIINFIPGFSRMVRLMLAGLLLSCAGTLLAQDTEAPAGPQAPKPVKNTFGSGLVMSDQSVMVPIKGTFEMDIQHRFGIVNQNEAKDLWGIYAPSNIRLGFSYAPINNLAVGFGLTKFKMQWDFNLKYGFFKQTPGGWPISATYFGNFAVDGRDSKYFGRSSDRFSFFHEIILARKITNSFSLQVAPTLSYFNSVEGYIDADGSIKGKMKNAHFALSVMGRYKISDKTAIIAGVDQPLTQHPLNNPYPNVCFGIEMTTSAHAFQIFAGNYQNILPQNDNVFNQFNYKLGQFLIGFNVTRLWNW